MFYWAKEHWYFVVGGVIALWVLMKLMASKASVGANVSTPGGTSMILGGTNANDAAVQVAQIQAQSGLAASQIASNQAQQVAAYSVQANSDTVLGNVAMNRDAMTAQMAIAVTNGSRDVAIAQAGDTAAVQVAGINAGRDVAIAGSQVQQAQYALDISNSNNAASMHISDNATLLGVNTNQTNLAAVQDHNATQLAAYGIQAQVVNNQTAAYRDVAVNAQNNNAQIQMNAINTAGAIEQQQLNNQSQLQNMTYSLEASGVFNKGGAGGTSQVAAWNALINPASASAGDSAVAQVATAQANSTANIINAIGSAVSNYIGAAAKAFA